MAESDNLQIFNIEVPADVINDTAEGPRKSNKKLENETVVELPIGDPVEAEPPKEKPKRETQKKKPERKRQTTQKKQTKQPEKAPEPEEDFSEAPAEEPGPEAEAETEELSNTSKEVLAALEMISDEPTQEEILLEPIEMKEEQKPAKPQGREAQKRKTRNKAPAKKLATPEEQKKAEALREQEAKPPIREIQVPPVRKKPQKQQSRNTTQKILSYIIPTQNDGMTEVIRKGIVIICIVVLLFSMGILIRSTHLQKKASKENAGNYFVKKYVYSYDINKDKQKENSKTENTTENEDSGEENK